MTEEQKKKLEQKLWDIASELRGRMDADEFRDYILVTWNYNSYHSLKWL